MRQCIPEGGQGWGVGSPEGRRKHPPAGRGRGGNGLIGSSRSWLEAQVVSAPASLRFVLSFLFGSQPQGKRAELIVCLSWGTFLQRSHARCLSCSCDPVLNHPPLSVLSHATVLLYLMSLFLFTRTLGLLGCHNKGPRTCRLEPHKCVFSRFWRPESEMGGWLGWCLPSLSPSWADGCLLTPSSDGLPPVRVCVLISSSYKDISHFRLGAHPFTITLF